MIEIIYFILMDMHEASPDCESANCKTCALLRELRTKLNQFLESHPDS